MPALQQSLICSGWKKISLLFIFLCSACSIPQPKPIVSELPNVPESESATLKVRSTINTSSVQHHHILYINDLVADLFEPDQVKTFQIGPGDHNLKVTCHTRIIRDSDYVPFNYNAVDSVSELDISVATGDSICLKVGFKSFSCASVEKVRTEFCERKIAMK